MSQLTTHVLDTALGKPAAGIAIRLYSLVDGNQQLMAEGITNADGRVPQFLPTGQLLEPAAYKLVFETGAYFKSAGRPVFYPVVEVSFNIADSSHYHVPLLLSPFGFSTYRGS
jgi:hydroxyisourate hydrolase